MQLNRKRIIVLLIYILTIAYYFSHLPMVKSMPCGCAFKHSAFIWEKSPPIFDLSTGKEVKWSIDWWRLAPKVLAATIIALLAFIWIGDEKSGWLEGISNVLNGFAVILLISALGLIALVLTYATINGYLPVGPWGEWPNNHGPWRYTFIFTDLPVFKLRMGLVYSFISLMGSVTFSTLSFILKPSISKGAILVVCILSFVLSINYLYWLID